MIELKLDLDPLIKKINFFSRRFIESEYSGEYVSFHRQKGVEFEDYKQFVPGDDASLIDWKASLRSTKLLVRRYIQARNLNILILLDISNSMLYSSISKLKCEYAAELAASLSYYFLQSSDNVGILLFNDKIVKYLPPAIGAKQFFLIKKILSDPKYYGGKYNLKNILLYANHLIGQSGVVIIISDFIGVKGNWDAAIGSLSKKADILSLIIRDPHDMKMDKKIGQALISDPFSDNVMYVDLDKIREGFEEKTRKNLDDIRIKLKKNRSESLELMTDKPFVEPVIKFFYERRLKWR